MSSGVSGVEVGVGMRCILDKVKESLVKGPFQNGSFNLSLLY